jgi:hypothetical protein
MQAGEAVESPVSKAIGNEIPDRYTHSSNDSESRLIHSWSLLGGAINRMIGASAQQRRHNGGA